MIVYLFDSVTFEYTGSYVCQESPLEPNVYIIPTDSTPIEPPTFTDLDTCIWNGSAWIITIIPVPIPPPPYVPTALDNKSTAASLLTATDWTTIADVGNPQMANPYLANQADFIAYRNAVRNMAVYPIEGNLTWPTVPTENWSKV